MQDTSHPPKTLDAPRQHTEDDKTLRDHLISISWSQAAGNLGAGVAMSLARGIVGSAETHLPMTEGADPFLVAVRKLFDRMNRYDTKMDFAEALADLVAGRQEQSGFPFEKD
jgi:hypothetical protein